MRLAVAFAVHESPYPGPGGPGGGAPSNGGRLPARFAFAWKVIVSVGGLIGTATLVLRPELRDTAAWLICGGAAGILPLDKLLDRFGAR